jgi:hypothetical protein
MSPAYGPQAVVGVTGLETTIDGVAVSSERLLRLQLPDKFTAEHMERVRNDLAILAETASEKPEEWMAFQNAALARDPSAARLADELGLTESKMLAKGGGVLWVVVVIAVAAALLLESDTPPTPQPATPDAGAPDGGAPDAGPG